MTFRLTTLSLAILLAGSSAVQAGTVKHSKPVDQANQTATVKTESPAQTANANWDPTPDNIPTNHSQFMQWAEDINGGKSREHLFSCWNDMLCVSGLLDLDALYFNRRGQPFGPTGSTGGAGVRPLFGPTTSQWNGSINNANIFVDLKFADLVRIHANVGYVNGSVKLDSYVWSNQADWGSTYGSAPAIAADELYAVFSNQKFNPFYLKIGRFYSDFGTYIPNGYGLPTITPSLTQLMTQSRTGGAQAGIALENGLYGSATWSMKQLTMEPFLSPNRNYSAKVGFARELTNAAINVNLSYIWDITDSDYLSGIVYVLNNSFVPAFGGNYTGAFRMQRQHAFAMHADGKFGQFGIGVEGAATTGGLNSNVPSSNLWTAGSDVSYDFATFGHDSSFDISYQIARHGRIVYGTGTMTTFPFAGATVGPLGNQFPASRVQLTYIFKVVPHVNTALQFVRDIDVGRTSGTGYTSDFGVFRIDLEF